MVAKRRLTESLSDDIWINIFETGINKSGFDIRDISYLSISCKRFNRVSEEDDLWSALLTLDFPEDDNISGTYKPSSKKDLYKYKLKRYLKRELKSHQDEFTKDEQKLIAIGEWLIQREARVRIEADWFSAKYHENISSWPNQYHEAFDWIYQLRRGWVEQFKDILRALLSTINSRESGVAFDYQLPPLSPFLVSDGCSWTPPCDFESKEAVLRLVQVCLSTQQITHRLLQRIHNCISDLLHRQREHGQKAVGIRSRLSSFTSSLPNDDNDDDEQNEDAKDDENDSNHDVEVP